MSVNAPVPGSMLYIETVFRLLFSPYANFPDGWIVVGPEAVPVVPANVKAPVVVSMA